MTTMYAMSYGRDCDATTLHDIRFEVLHMQGKRILVANEAEDDKTDLMNDFTSIIYSFAARLYGVRGARSRTKRAVAAFIGESGATEE